MKDGNIIECLGIEIEEFERMQERAIESFTKNKFHSDAILELIDFTKNDCFGDTDAPTSDYEKLLFLIGIQYGILFLISKNNKEKDGADPI